MARSSIGYGDVVRVIEYAAQRIGHAINYADAKMSRMLLSAVRMDENSPTVRTAARIENA
jgi:hypothetical protein